MTQLDAVAIYKNYKENKEKTIDQFEKILACGFSKPIDKLYEIAGIKFDFTKKIRKRDSGFYYQGNRSFRFDIININNEE